MQRAMLLLIAIFLAALLVSDAQIPKVTGQPTHGDAMLADYFQDEVTALSSNCLANIETLEDWESKRAEYRRQLQEMLGLWPMPERTDLQPVVTSRIEHGDFTVEKFYYQPLPKLYVTANLYLPTNLDRPAPAVLYECGHWAFKTNGINYGNKAVYQSDGAWYARNGYVCLVADTVLAGEIPGIHTGTRDHGLWWWNSRGYTPAGVEAWLGLRALDYLCSRPEVDTNRIGITGHSGGGAYSWTVTALDDRVKVAAPLAGMADARSHMLDGVIDSHCDCNFFINIYHWDFPQVAALAAPRPLLIGGTDRDQGFRLDSTMRIYEKVRRIYQLYGATNKLGLIIAPGIHDETPELQLAVMRWFNRYLKGEEKPVEITAKRFFPPTELKVFAEVPTDSINSNIASSFVPMFDESGSGRESAHSSPGNQSRLTSAATNSSQLRAELHAKVFSGWPGEATSLGPKRAFSMVRGGVRFSAWDFTSQPDVTLRFYLLENPTHKSAETVLLNIIGQNDWNNWANSMVLVFGDQLQGELGIKASPESAVSKRRPLEMAHEHEAVAFFAPRGIGLDAWSGDEKRLTQIRRRFMLLGQTMDGMRVWDIRRAIQTIHSLPELESAQIELHATDGEAVNALYAALFEPTVHELDLLNLPDSHMDADAPDYLNVLKITDIPQVMGAESGQAEVKLEAP
ncbi:MAG TPA: alpha/beta hydrolase family protein [Candidatus Nitrosopolaris sp.]|nr:alpha/beta hydrolase family protein [Candidatus Nitrosopolaris sp.]